MSASILVTVILQFIFIDIIIAQDYFLASNGELSLTWEQANSLCDTSTPRGQLASSHNISHDNAMHTLCQSTGADSCWIGLYRESNQQEWKWRDNSEFSHRFKSNLNSMPASTDQSCISLITSSEEPEWSYGDCFEALSSAICSTCGELDEYCCSIGDGCNGNNMKCVNNQCVASVNMEVTEYFTTTDIEFSTSYYFLGPPERSGFHIDNPSTMVISGVIILVIVFNIICCILKRRKLKMIEQYETNRMSEHHELTPVKSNDVQGDGNENDVTMNMNTADHENSEEHKYYED